MEKFELTAAEVMSTLNWKKSKVYYWINSGKFETVERETGTNVLLTSEQIQRLKTETVSEGSNEFENSSETSEKVLKKSEQNITKHYETVSNSSNIVDVQFYNDALSTMKEMYQTFVQSQSYNMKLLTDGKNETETKVLELRAENKELSQKVLKFSNLEIVKNTVIAIISILLLISLVAIGILSNCLINSQTDYRTEIVEQSQTMQENVELKPKQPLVKTQRK